MAYAEKAAGFLIMRQLFGNIFLKPALPIAVKINENKKIYNMIHIYNKNKRCNYNEYGKTMERGFDFGQDRLQA